MSAADVPNLQAANCTAIQCLGERELTITLAGQPDKWTFLLADVEDPLLGADFLRHFGLVVDLNAGCLIQAETLQRIGDGMGTAVFSEVLSVVEATPPRLRALLSQFPDVLNSSGELPPSGSKISAVRCRQIAGSQERISSARAAGDSQEIQQSVVNPSPYGDEERWDLAALRRLPPIERNHGP
jgi:hypothetical protein